MSSIKTIKLDWSMGTHFSLFTEAVTTSLQHDCNDVQFEFNGGVFSVSQKSVWNDNVYNKLSSYPREEGVVKL